MIGLFNEVIKQITLILSIYYQSKILSQHKIENIINMKVGK